MSSDSWRRLPAAPPPQFTETRSRKPSPLFSEFVLQCLYRNPDDRATLDELRQHPFLTLDSEENEGILDDLVASVTAAAQGAAVLDIEQTHHVQVMRGPTGFGFGVDNKGTGVFVDFVEQSGAAEANGLKEGMQIMTINKVDVSKAKSALAVTDMLAKAETIEMVLEYNTARYRAYTAAPMPTADQLREFILADTPDDDASVSISPSKAPESPRRSRVGSSIKSFFSRK